MPLAAERAAEQALGAARGVGDGAGEKQARRELSELRVDAGRAEAAPNRMDALEALNDLAYAVEERRGDVFKRAMARLDEASGFSGEDVQRTLAPIIEKYRVGASRFLKSVGFDGAGASATAFKQFPKRYLYLNFRVGGLGYGPRFRNCQTQKITQASGEMAACASLQTWDEQEQWGKDLMYHP